MIFISFLFSGGALSKSSSKTADTVILSPVRRTTSISSFTFSEPVALKKLVPESLKMTNGDGKKSSQHFSFSQPVQVLGTDRVTSNHLPDLTSSMVSGPVKARVNKEVQPLKFGSVMDILGGKSACFSTKEIVLFLHQIIVKIQNLYFFYVLTCIIAIRCNSV